MTEPNAAEHGHEPGSFLTRYIFSQDHKVIGIQYLVTAMAVAVFSGALAMLIRLQLSWPGTKWPLMGVMTEDFYLAMITMHGTLMVFFVISFGLLSGFGNYLIPLQIGARDMAYPFLNMLSYWVAFLATLIMFASFFVPGGAAAAGWTSYPPLSAVPAAVAGSNLGQTFWLLGMALFIVSFTMGGLNYFTTVINLRAKGMSMMRMPLTVWTMFISAILGLLAFPPLTAAAILLLFDRHGGTSFYLPSGLYFGSKLLATAGGTPLLWQHLFWFLGHPEVYILLLPALGVAFDVLAPFIRKPIFGYRITIYSLGIMAVLSMIVWGHHMFVSGMNPYIGEFFSIATLLITLPSAIIGVNLLASLWGARIRLTTPMLFALGVIIMFGIGGFGGIFLGNATSDIFLHDTYFVVGHFHFMIAGVTLFGLFAAVYFWFPKMFGRMMNNGLGRLHFWFTLVPFYLMFLVMHFQGLRGTPRRYYSFEKFEYLRGLENVNLFMTIAGLVLGIAQFVFLFNFFWSAWKGAKVGNNPWGASTLEWTAPSPPPHGNWGATMPTVHRWPYDYSVPDAPEDFTPQIVSAAEVKVTS